jgi:DNA-binding transcriptional MerR regulator
VENGGTKDSYTIGEVVARLRPEFPTLSVSKIRYLERRRLINLSRTRGGYRLFSNQDIELLRYILTLQDKEYLPLKVIKKRIEGGAPVTSTDSAGDPPGSSKTGPTPATSWPKLWRPRRASWTT